MSINLEEALGAERLGKYFTKACFPENFPDHARVADDWVMRQIAYDLWSTLAKTGLPMSGAGIAEFDQQPESVRALCYAMARNALSFVSTFEECKALNNTPAPLLFRPPEHGSFNV